MIGRGDWKGAAGLGEAECRILLHQGYLAYELVPRVSWDLGL